MLLRIDRYLIREISLTLFATLLALLAIVLSHRLAGFFSKAANGLLARDFVLPLLGLQAVYLATVLIPLAFLLSIVLALGRLYHDHEMTALAACGYGPLSIDRAVLLLAIPLSLVTALLSLVIVPATMEKQFEVLAQARKAAEASLFTAGTFREVQGGEQVVYVGAIDAHSLQQVFVQTRHADGTISITTGAQGHQEISEEGARHLVLAHGYRYQGLLGEQGQEMLRFERAALRLEKTAPPQTAPRRETLSNAELFASQEPADIAEWHLRLNSPLQILIIALWAPPLARLRPREGRYGRVIAAVLIYAIDFNLVGIGESWLSHARVSSMIGLWWVHSLFLGLGLLLLLRDTRGGRFYLRKRCSAPQTHGSLD